MKLLVISNAAVCVQLQTSDNLLLESACSLLCILIPLCVVCFVIVVFRRLSQRKSSTVSVLCVLCDS